MPDLLTQLRKTRREERRAYQRRERLTLKARDQGYTQREIADALGVTQQSLGKWLQRRGEGS